MAHVIWSAEASWNLELIGDYLDEASPGQRERILNSVIDATVNLGRFPEMGRVIPELGEPSLRELIVGRYRVFYEFDGGTVIIMMVMDAARDARSRLLSMLGGP